MLHSVPRRVLGVPTDDVLPYNYGEVFSEEGNHAGLPSRQVDRCPSPAILPVDGRPGTAFQEEPRVLYPSVYIDITQRLYYFLLSSKN